MIAAARLLLGRWWPSLSIAGILAALGLAMALAHYRHAYHAERALRQADRAAYANAQAQAAVVAQNALRAAENRYRSKANEADQAYAANLADARSRAGAYIDRMRIKAPSRDASGALASAESGGAQSADQSDSAPVMVAVTAADVGVCTDNTQRLEAAREWVLGLNTGQ